MFHVRQRKINDKHLQKKISKYIVKQGINEIHSTTRGREIT